MIALGLILLVLGLIFAVHVLFIIGIVLLVVGLVIGFAPGPWAGSGTTRRRYY